MEPDLTPEARPPDSHPTQNEPEQTRTERPVYQTCKYSIGFSIQETNKAKFGGQINERQNLENNQVRYTLTKEARKALNNNPPPGPIHRATNAIVVETEPRTL